MIKGCLTLLLFITLLPFARGVSVGRRQDRPAAPPAPPPATVPRLNRRAIKDGTAEVLDLKSARPARARRRRPPFDPSTHDRLNEQVLTSVYARELWKALYLQDTYHQFESKVHFDNCDFDDGLDYIADLLRECDGLIAKSEAERRAGRQGAADNYVRQAFFSLGQALHGIQDFYAHSNFVELMKNSGRDLIDVEPVPVWLDEGRQQVKQLQSRGLISGYVSWGTPKRCGAGVPSHRELAKDSRTMKSGGVVVPRWENLTQYDAAYLLARASSSAFLRYAFDRWPTLGQKGTVMAYRVFQERRKL